MHEFSLVQGLMGQLETLAAENGAERILLVTMEIGPFSGVVVDSFRFGFEALAPLTPLTRNARLIVLQLPQRYGCRDCDNEQDMDGDARPEDCPCCGSREIFPLGADDVVLRQVEME
ncbi:MAG: hydrogenase maturation nickel metallochaperone HypA [Desulfobulbaceae bacterium]|uniref:Hydrogenase maturation factor HypA n=1 Tax=Candidatus Desulfatifera sulfidica TaxID=2841691 RepID=A0A8J6N5U8_9BACT|nr:hydrogenase maturation nickel metallochaperone HypA [Candidatus Desulfatifera sulfidica]